MNVATTLPAIPIFSVMHECTIIIGHLHVCFVTDACMWSEFLLNMTELHLLCLLSVFVYPKFLNGQNSVT